MLNKTRENKCDWSWNGKVTRRMQWQVRPRRYELISYSHKVLRVRRSPRPPRWSMSASFVPLCRFGRCTREADIRMCTWCMVLGYLTMTCQLLGLCSCVTDMARITDQQMGGSKEFCSKFRNPASYPGGRYKTFGVTSVSWTSKDFSVLHEPSCHEDIWRYISTHS